MNPSQSLLQVGEGVLPLAKPNLQKLIIGGVISYIVVTLLTQVDRRLAWLYLLLVFMVTILAYKDQIFPAILNLTSGVAATMA